MKTKKITLIIILATLFISCEDYLEKQQDFEGLQQEDVFSDIRLAKAFLDDAYTLLLTEVSAIGGNSDHLPAMAMAGEAHAGRVNSDIPVKFDQYANGDYLSLMNYNNINFAVRYSNSWKGIRVVNSFLENVDYIGNTTPEETDRLKGQAYFLRAFFYHLMTKRHGGLPYLTMNLQLDGSFDRERESYESNLVNMLEDLNLAIDLLPSVWPSENVGRPTKGAAMALKSRLTLFAASPLVNESNSQQAWEDAAASASTLIDFANTNGLYTLVDASSAINIDVDHNGSDLFESEPEALKPYRSIFVGPGVSKVIPQEVIFSEVSDLFGRKGAGLSGISRLSLTTGFDVIKGNFFPLGFGANANFVDKFETKNGLSIKDDPSYNPQEPFINRDPRFYNTILYDGVAWTVTAAGAINKTGFADLARVNKKGKVGVDLHNPSIPSSQLWKVRNLTGYRVRKWCPNGAYWRSGNNGNWDFHVNSTIFRMSEVYLNYAEAVNEAYGPSGTAPGSSLTALDAVNIIRNRVGMPNVNAIYSGSKELLRERIRNERAIELCFEGGAYDDLRRWKVAHLEENTKVEFLDMRWQGGESATYPSGFSYQNVEQVELQKTFPERNYWWPVPSSELEAVPSFKQTPGW